MIDDVITRVSAENCIRSHLAQIVIHARELYAASRSLGYSAEQLATITQLANAAKSHGRTLDQLPPPPRPEDQSLFNAHVAKLNAWNDRA